MTAMFKLQVLVIFNAFDYTLKNFVIVFNSFLISSW